MSRSRVPLPRPILIGLFGVVAAAATVWGAREARERRELHRQFVELRETLADLRLASIECQGDVAREEAAFHAYNERIDSLREEVRELEALDERGVPHERYEEYMEAFELYNRSVPDWRRRADSLQILWEECQTLVLRHNLLADSVRRTVGPGAEGDS